MVPLQRCLVRIANFVCSGAFDSTVLQCTGNKGILGLTHIYLLQGGIFMHENMEMRNNATKIDFSNSFLTYLSVVHWQKMKTMFTFDIHCNHVSHIECKIRLAFLIELVTDK